ncbi:membrane protein [Alkalibacterium iburiense]|uniref:Membrane protein n=1 Tax=Alkalibacterium iburiense TaxID=290589 RepID=A0ABN0XF90_9LACT
MKKIKLTYSLIGVLFISLAVTFFRLADLGTDPYTTFNLGVSDFLNMAFGVFIMVSSLLMLVFIYFMDRSLVGIGTLFNIFIVGNLSDVLVALYTQAFGVPENLVVRVIFSILGIVCLAMGAALYIEAEEGIAPYDALPIILAERVPRLSFRVSRVILDTLFSVIGFLFGATIGVNTLVTAFLLGPFIQFFRDIFKKDIEARRVKHLRKNKF